MRFSPLMEVIGMIPAIIGMRTPASAQHSRKIEKVAIIEEQFE